MSLSTTQNRHSVHRPRLTDHTQSGRSPYKGAPVLSGCHVCHSVPEGERPEWLGKVGWRGHTQQKAPGGY
jgi:hypothetical protein